MGVWGGTLQTPACQPGDGDHDAGGGDGGGDGGNDVGGFHKCRTGEEESPFS